MNVSDFALLPGVPSTDLAGVLSHTPPVAGDSRRAGGLDAAEPAFLEHP